MTNINLNCTSKEQIGFGTRVIKQAAFVKYLKENATEKEREQVDGFLRKYANDGKNNQELRLNKIEYTPQTTPLSLIEASFSKDNVSDNLGQRIWGGYSYSDIRESGHGIVDTVKQVISRAIEDQKIWISSLDRVGNLRNTPPLQKS